MPAFILAGIGIPALQYGMPKRAHLHRLRQIWAKQPLYFITVCCTHRRPILSTERAARVLVDSWHASSSLNGWAVGRYVIMPDHVHFFARAQTEAKSLSAFMRDWKRWTANQIIKTTGVSPPLWQPEFFDHILRSAGSYAEKWAYVQANPVRAGLVATADAWPCAGECEVLRF